jgi:hypothetical protein
MQDFVACDVHPATGNVVYCCRELGANHFVYKRMMELSTSVNKSNQYIPMDVDEVIFGVLENLMAALEVRTGGLIRMVGFCNFSCIPDQSRANQYDENTKGKTLHRSIGEVGVCTCCCLMVNN